MPFQIRHKETGLILTMNSGKSVWARVGHAKASLKTSGVCREHRQKIGLKSYQGMFDFALTSNIFEIVEVTEKGRIDPARLLDILERASQFTECPDLHALIKELKE
jgi:hypothetical protein